MTRKNLFITGASTGIGAATAELAAQQGWNVAIGYQSSRDAAEAVADLVRQAGGEALTVQGDVGDPSAIPGIFKAVDAMGPMQGFVNNAGIVGPAQRVEEMTAERVARIMAINVTGAILCAGQAVRRMSTRFGGTGGSLVNISSAAARLGSPNQYVDYAASKGAIDTFTQGLALEVAGDGIRVTGVRPGVIETDIHAKGGQPDRAAQLGPTLPMGRAGSAMEVAQGIVWLLSDHASYVSGTTIDISWAR